MFGRSENPQHWSVHAEFTISHPGINDPENLPQTNTEQGDNNVRMTYTWTSDQANNPGGGHFPSPPPSSNRSVYSDVTPKPYGFQRGNMLFTSTPARRPPNLGETVAPRLGVQDSGYGSDLLSPNSGSCLLPRRPVQPYNRKCRSTCSIVLSTIHDENRTEDVSDHGTQCGRTQSLRCQTPTLRCDRRDSFYGCGDPWCHHVHYDDLSGRFSPVMEMCEECPGSSRTGSSATATTCTTARCCDRSRVSSLPPEDTGTGGRKDASVQTFEMIDKCTSPFLKMGEIRGGTWDKEKKAKKKYGQGSRRKTEPIYQRSQSPSSITPDSLDNPKIRSRRLVSRSPKFGRVAVSEEKTNSATESKCSDPSKKPRTVHIDVYCTGTEMESDSSSESSEEGTASTPQTVFESEKVRITHKRANDKQLPYSVGTNNTDTGQESRRDSLEKKCEKVESDYDDGASTAYPSKLSSYSTIRDFSSSVSSVPRSWTTYSMSSCTVPDDYDSVANTSWKDTFSDIDSLLQSRSSIAATESLDFVPRRLYEKNPSIDEAPEYLGKNEVMTPSRESLQPSDSFEYADSEDRLRIRRMEELWKNKQQGKVWRSPQSERRLLMQQKKIQEYMDRRIGDKKVPKWESKESESEGSDGSEKGWTFVKDETNENERDKHRIVEERLKTGEARLALVEKSKITEKFGRKPEKLEIPENLNKPKEVNKSDVSKTERLNLDPTLRAPFMIVPGMYTDQRAVANKFGSIVNAFKKPGHHIGPVKNPDCRCDHCQRHFQNVGYRNRARSMGDPPAYQVPNWRDSNYPQSESNSNRSVPSQLYTDF